MARLLGDHLYPDFGMNLGMQPDHNGMLARRLDRVLQLDPAPVHGVALAGKCIRNVLRGDGAKELSFFSSLSRQSKGHLAQGRREEGATVAVQLPAPDEDERYDQMKLEMG